MSEFVSEDTVEEVSSVSDSVAVDGTMVSVRERCIQRPLTRGWPLQELVGARVV